MGSFRHLASGLPITGRIPARVAPRKSAQLGLCFLALGLTRLALQKRILEMLWLLTIPLLLSSPSLIRSLGQT